MHLLKKTIPLFFLLSSFGYSEIGKEAYHISQCIGFHGIKQAQPYYVGELGEKWTFPSDHLPVGLTIDDCHLVLWNVLNKNYLEYIEQNTQGLKDSSIMKNNVPLPGQKNLTIREFIILKNIFEMIEHPSHPRSLIALQEIHPDMINYFRKYLPKHFAILMPPGCTESEDIFLYDKRVFHFVDSQASYYTKGRPKTVFTIDLENRSSGKVYRFIQSHIPGGPRSEEACRFFSQVVLDQYVAGLTTVLMGDMNQSPQVISRHLFESALEKGFSSSLFDWAQLSYPSHVNTHCEASWIDHFFVSSQENYKTSSDPKELFSSLSKTVQLLEESKGESPPCD